MNFPGSTPNVEDSDSEESEFDLMEIDESGLPYFQRRQETRKAQSKPIPAAGTKELGQVAMFDSTGGLVYRDAEGPLERASHSPAHQVCTIDRRAI